MRSAKNRRSKDRWSPRALYREPAARVPFPPLLPATLISRPNRFVVEARTARGRVRAACRDPGRLEDLLAPGAELRLARAGGARRRTRFTLVLVRHRRRWVCLIPALANDVLERALLRGGVPGLEGVAVVRREVRVGDSRLDLLLRRRGRLVLTEVKSVAWRIGARGLFPDAPTARGRRHVEELIRHRREGGRALLVFVAQRSDIRVVEPARSVDPQLAEALERALRAGVEVLAYGCRVGLSGCRLAERLPFQLGS